MDRRENEAAFAEPLQMYQEALRLFRDRQWEKAARMFEEVEKILQTDAASSIYRLRCADLLRENPDDWSCITVLDHK